MYLLAICRSSLIKCLFKSFAPLKKFFLSYLFLTCVYAQSLSCVRLCETPWAIACQAPLSMGFSRQEYWSGLPLSFPGNLPNPGIETRSPALQAGSLPSELALNPIFSLILINLFIFGCPGSVLLHAGKWRLLSGCSAQVLSSGFSSFGSWALEHRLISCGLMGLVASRLVESSWTKD